MIGERIGNYLVARKLGEGGMGAVFEAVHQQLGRHVAIKVLHAQYSHDPQVAARFFNEAKAVNVIDHPGLVDIYEFGHLPSGAAYIIMEYLKGESLTARLQRAGGRLPQPDTLRLSKQVASALAAAHAKEIVHRDLKPDNVMIVPDPDALEGERAKVLDFGIAKVADAHSGGSDVKTRTGMMMGTPVYMSPEQCRGAGGVDDRSDVYALGVMMYHMITGAPPFLAEGLGDLVVKHIMEPPRPLQEAAPGTHPGLVALVHGMLAKQPGQRPSMAQVVGELNQLGQSSPGASAAAWSSGVAFSGTGPALALGSGPSTLGQAAGQAATGAGPVGGGSMWPSLAGGQPGARRLPLLGAAALGLLLIGGLGTYAALRPGKTTDGTTGKDGATIIGGQGVNPVPDNDLKLANDPPDVRNLDVSQFLRRARAEARQRMPDAELNTLIAMCVKPDGSADLSLCSGVVMYRFRSAAKSVRGDVPIGVRMPCLVQVVVQQQMGMIVQTDSSDKCDEPISGTPRCKPRDLWQRALKKGAPKNAIASQMVFLNKQWYVTIGDLSLALPDDC